MRVGAASLARSKVAHATPPVPRRGSASEVRPGGPEQSARPVRSQRQSRPVARPARGVPRVYRAEKSKVDEDWLRALAPPRSYKRALVRRFAREQPRTLSREIGVVEQHSVKKATLIMYETAVATFKRVMGVDPSLVSARVLDTKMVQYFDNLFLEGAAPQNGERLWAGIRFLVPDYAPKGSLSLPRAWRSLRGWKRLMPQPTRRPLPWEAVASIAHQMCTAGELGMALSWLLMVDCYLRPGECLRLGRRQLLPKTKVKFMTTGVLLLHPDERGVCSKTGELNESLAIRRPWLSDMMCEWASSRRSEMMWDHTAAQMRKLFLAAAHQLHLQKWRPVMYMGRHSGASLDRLQDVIPLREVQRRGRWNSETSVRRYEKRALTQEVYLSMPPAVRNRAHRHERELIPLLRRTCAAQCAAKRARRA